MAAINSILLVERTYFVDHKKSLDFGGNSCLGGPLKDVFARVRVSPNSDRFEDVVLFDQVNQPLAAVVNPSEGTISITNLKDPELEESLKLLKPQVADQPNEMAVLTLPLTDIYACCNVCHQYFSLGEQALKPSNK